MRILICEPDPYTSNCIDLMLTKAGMNCYATDNGEEAIELAKIYEYDLIVTELTFADIDGFEVIRTLRKAKVETPVLIVSGMDDSENKVKGFGVGADDYLTKPFHRDELVARITAIVRRWKGHAQSVIRTGNMTVNLDAKMVEVKGYPVHLTGKEYQILELLSLRKGHTVTKEMFLNHLYGGMDEPELKIIDVFVCKLRKKLEAYGPNYIHTTWGIGYRLAESIAR